MGVYFGGGVVFAVERRGFVESGAQQARVVVYRFAVGEYLGSFGSVVYFCFQQEKIIYEFVKIERNFKK
jgi:hypothetical protein